MSSPSLPPLATCQMQKRDGRQQGSENAQRRFFSRFSTKTAHVCCSLVHYSSTVLKSFCCAMIVSALFQHWCDGTVDHTAESAHNMSHMYLLICICFVFVFVLHHRCDGAVDHTADCSAHMLISSQALPWHVVVQQEWRWRWGSAGHLGMCCGTTGVVQRTLLWYHRGDSGMG